MSAFTIAPRSTISTQGRSRHTLERSRFEFFNRIGHLPPFDDSGKLFAGELASDY